MERFYAAMALIQIMAFPVIAVIWMRREHQGYELQVAAFAIGALCAGMAIGLEAICIALLKTIFQA